MIRYRHLQSDSAETAHVPSHFLTAGAEGDIPLNRAAEMQKTGPEESEDKTWITGQQIQDMTKCSTINAAKAA